MTQHPRTNPPSLLSNEWAVLQKEVNGVEDVPCSRVDDAEGPGSYENTENIKKRPDSGDWLDKDG
jgi:hypothetical protein